MWQIIGGERVDVWKDKWIKDIGILGDRNSPDLEERVPQKAVELLDKGNFTWKLESIKGLVSNGVVRAIQRIPVCTSEGPDKRIWPYCKDGEYSVKSGYHALRGKEEKIIKDLSTLLGVESKIWKIIWKLPIPNKIWTFFYVKPVIMPLLLQGICGRGNAAEIRYVVFVKPMKKW